MIKEIKKKKKSRSYPPTTSIKLWTAAGGRCEFNGCNEYLLRDALSLKESNQSNIAHIVGLNGPRSYDVLPMEERNEVENLMLVCKKHHGIFDDGKLVPGFPKEKLLEMKRVHEERIFNATEMKPEAKTFAICFKSNIAGEMVQIPFSQIEEAVYPSYPMNKKLLEIDLTKLPDLEDPSYWNMGIRIIEDNLKKYYHPQIESGEIRQISVFGLASIPLLISLGNQLSNKVKTDIYQRHRDTENWKWKDTGKLVKYKKHLLKSGNDKSKVALILSLSGPIKIEDLPKEIQQEYYLYEITLDNMEPNTGFLRRKEDLESFQSIYQNFLGEIRKKHGGVKEIFLFPAMPAPIAVMCGRELLKKAHPTLKVYDLNKKEGGFRYILSVN